MTSLQMFFRIKADLVIDPGITDGFIITRKI